MTSTQGIPFLRYKSGPQSQKLSWALRSMYGQNTRRWTSYDRLVDEVNHGFLEDNWDVLVHGFTGVRDQQEGGDVFDGIGQKGLGPVIRGRGGEAVVEFKGLRGSQSWAGEAKTEFEVLKRRLADVTAKRSRMARRMKGIVDSERMLAEREKKERKEIARARWLASQAGEEKSEIGGAEGPSRAGVTSARSTGSPGGRAPPSSPRDKRGIQRAMQPDEPNWSPMR